MQSQMFCRLTNAPLQQVIKELREIADETRREQQEAAVANSRRWTIANCFLSNDFFSFAHHLSNFFGLCFSYESNDGHLILSWDSINCYWWRLRRVYKGYILLLRDETTILHSKYCIKQKTKTACLPIWYLSIVILQKMLPSLVVFGWANPFCRRYNPSQFQYAMLSC